MLPEIENDVADSIAARFDDQSTKRSHVHDFVVIANQTTVEDASETSVISLVCRQCDHHFVVRVNRGGDGQLCNDGCPKYIYSNIEFPAPEGVNLAHHIVATTQWTQEMVEQKKSPTYPLLCRAEFCCSIGDCPLQISVEVSGPRLALEWVRMLKDPNRLRQNLDKARENDPDRFADAKEESVDSAFSVLQTYIRNHLGDPSARKISKRNKRFQVVFGHELLPLFYALGYSEETSDNKGAPEDVLSPQPLEPAPKGNSPTPIESLRAFADDMLTESLHHSPSREFAALTGGTDRLERELHCANWPRRLGGRHVEDTHSFSALGVLPQMHRTLIYYGYQAQQRACPKEEPFLFDSLMSIATVLSDEDLQAQAVCQRSENDTKGGGSVPFEAQSNSTGRSEAVDAAKYFGLNDPISGNDSVILAKYGEKIGSEAAEAKRQLQILSTFRGSKRLQETLDGQLSYTTALEILQLTGQSDCTDDFVVAYTGMQLNDADSKFLRQQVIEALRLVAVHRNSTLLDAHYRELAGKQPAGDSPDMPVGLHNIGNTCYLNSCLQTFYSIKPIRELVMNPANQLVDLKSSDISTRKIGYNKRGVSVDEALLGNVFADELGKLFKTLATTPYNAIRPSQLLANSVLLNAGDISRKVEKKEDEASKAEMSAPPPLPDRPTLGRVERVDDARDVDMVNVSVDAISETASTRSSGTLVDQTMENTEPIQVKDLAASALVTQGIKEDVIMTDVPDHEAELAFKSKAIEQALATQERASGTTQQDVEETLGSMLNHLQNIIVPYSITGDVQKDIVTDLCFFELQRYSKKEGETSFEKSGDKTLERSIVAYPGDGPRTIYEGISHGLDLEHLEGNRYLFGAISGLPKILFVHIQRTQSIHGKNNNIVAVEETMYLDRFMDADQDSDLMRLRQCAWLLQQQQKLLVATHLETTKDLETPQPKSSPVIYLDDEIDPVIDSVLFNRPAAPLTLSAQPFDITPPTQEDLDSYAASKPVTLDIEGLPTLEEIKAMSEKQIQATREAVDRLFSQQQTQKYDLHAVICHSGQMTAGHYWNWIHDTEAGKWRKYNDATVTETTNTAECLAELNRAGEPYLLCYVRDDVRDEVVNVPKRTPQPSVPQTDVVEITSDDFAEIKSAATTVEISIDDMTDDFPSVARHNSPVNGVNGTSPPNDKHLSAA
ncbi:hypothetical protein F5X68DRAFT_12147 [Plectosphaerella plurivora]|uniref:ubiquitinyl hydrolase 1 n=1 Tax=Plectosphaerella plurivora TaxID=936078 RepID=A0A9P8V9I3_9PEZI|nr:hypothetical protein F5X68DRAFT_12147 [Plectosphaerella plurivora]